MALTLGLVQRELEADEPDYSTLATQWGTEALPYLRTLANDPSPMLAPRAIFLAGKIAGPGAASIVSEAAKNPDPRWRVAAAAAAADLSDAEGSAIIATLITDPDTGVRKLAVESTPDHPSQELKTLLRQTALTDKVEGIRRLAHDAVSRTRE